MDKDEEHYFKALRNRTPSKLETLLLARRRNIAAGSSATGSSASVLDPWLNQLLSINTFNVVGQKNELKEVPIAFESEHEYVEVFYPLLLEEVKAQAYNEYEKKSTSFCTHDVNQVEQQGDIFHIIGGFSQYSENDLLLITNDDQSPGDVHCMGMVNKLKRVTICLPDSHLIKAGKMLKKGSRWYMYFIMNITSQIREIKALWSIFENPLRHLILKPLEVQESNKRDQSTMGLTCSFNESQLKAINGAITGRGISLIQGPPGTGKTQTILAILSSLLVNGGGTTTLLDDVSGGLSNVFEKAWRRTELGLRLGGKFEMARTSKGRYIRHGRVLVCAQSNAAVDELLSRISSHGLSAANKKIFMPFLVRVGKAVESLPFSLENLFEQYAKADIDPPKYQSRFDTYNRFLNDAELVITTLSGCGGQIYRVFSEAKTTSGSGIGLSLFDFVIVDEAAQALEPTCLIPMQLLKPEGSLVMVGDPKQLPPLVFSRDITKYKYGRSLFERLQDGGHPVTFLTTQYRMHPEISQFPSACFYNNKLEDGVCIMEKTKIYHKTTMFRPYLVYDIFDGIESYRMNSYENETEAEAVLEMLKCFQRSYSHEFSSEKIGIITFYLPQVSVLRNTFTVLNSKLFRTSERVIKQWIQEQTHLLTIN